MTKHQQSFMHSNVFWIIIALAVLGQIAWGLENSWFNTFVYDEITANTQPIAIMNGASAAAATITTFVMGTLSDRRGKRKPFIKWGYVIWGITTAGFYICKFFPGVYLQCAMVVVLDCVMTFFGSTANDACFNAWTTDISDTGSRGQITSIVQIAPLISGIILAFAGAVVDHLGYAVFFIGTGALVSLTGLIAGSALQDSTDLKPNPEAGKISMLKQAAEAFSSESIKNNRTMFLILTAVCVLLCGFQVSFAYEMIYANQFLKISKTWATFLTAAALPVMVFASVYTGRKCDAGKGFKALEIAPILFVSGAVLHGLAPNIVFIIIARALLYGGWMTMMVAATAMFKNLEPQESRGRYEGVRMVFMVLVPMIIGPEIGSLLISANGIQPILYLVSGLIALFAYIPIVILRRDASVR
ncbi:MAG: MFS transporter [Erysipelotrichia bacterium]|nr:MFS transporter [Erysipelotrichia bacterium]